MRNEIVLSADICQPEIPALEQVSQFLVIEPEQSKSGRVNVIDVEGVLHRLEPNLIGRANHLAAFDTAAGHPHVEAVGIVVAPPRYPVVRKNNSALRISTIRPIGSDVKSTLRFGR